MTHTISMSELRAAGIEDVHGAVSEYAEAVRRWTEHHERVKADALKPEPVEPIPADFPGDEEFETAYQQWAREVEERHQPYPVDLHHPAVMAAVQVNGAEVTTDYELVDDTPTPDDVLRSKKNVLQQQVLDEENRRKGAILPPGRTRRMMIQLRGVQERDLARQTEFIEGLNLAGLKSDKEQKDAVKRINERRLEHGRPPEDQRFMDTFDDIQRRQAVVDDRSAVLMDEVEDLTPENVDDWKLTWGGE